MIESSSTLKKLIDFSQKEGGVKMPEYPVSIEVERIMNLAANFGWSKVKEEMIDEDLHLTIKKAFPFEAEKVIEGEAG